MITRQKNIRKVSKMNYRFNLCLYFWPSQFQTIFKVRTRLQQYLQDQQQGVASGLKRQEPIRKMSKNMHKKARMRPVGGNGSTSYGSTGCSNGTSSGRPSLNQQSQGQDEKQEGRNGARVPAGGTRYGQKSAMAKGHNEQAAHGNASGSKSGSRSCRGGNPSSHQQKHQQHGSGAAQQDSHSQVDYYACREEWHDDHYQASSLHASQSHNSWGSHTNGRSSYGHGHHDKRYAHHHGSSNASAGMASPEYQAAPQREPAQSSNHKPRDFANYDNDYDHEMYASGAVADEKNHHQLKGYSYRGKRCGQQRYFTASGSSNAGGGSAGPNGFDAGSQSDHHGHHYHNQQHTAMGSGSGYTSSGSAGGYGGGGPASCGGYGGSYQGNYSYPKAPQFAGAVGSNPASYYNQQPSHQASRGGPMSTVGAQYQEDEQIHGASSKAFQECSSGGGRQGGQMQAPGAAGSGAGPAGHHGPYYYGGQAPNTHSTHGYNYDGHYSQTSGAGGSSSGHEGRFGPYPGLAADAETATSGGAHCSGVPASAASSTWNARQLPSGGYPTTYYGTSPSKKVNTNRFTTMSQGAHHPHPRPHYDNVSSLSQGDQTRAVRDTNHDYQTLNSKQLQQYGGATGGSSSSAQSSNYRFKFNGNRNSDQGQQQHQNSKHGGAGQQNYYARKAPPGTQAAAAQGIVSYGNAPSKSNTCSSAQAEKSRRAPGAQDDAAAVRFEEVTMVEADDAANRNGEAHHNRKASGGNGSRKQQQFQTISSSSTQNSSQKPKTGQDGVGYVYSQVKKQYGKNLGGNAGQHPPRHGPGITGSHQDPQYAPKGSKYDKRGGGQHQASSEYYHAKGGDSNAYRSERRSYICQVCKVALQEAEKDFYPCNCKYQICFKCYQRQVDEKERKCPNCFKHYDWARVEEYKQSRIAKAAAGPSQKNQAQMPADTGSRSQKAPAPPTGAPDRKDVATKNRAPQYQIKQKPGPPAEKETLAQPQAPGSKEATVRDVVKVEKHAEKEQKVEQAASAEQMETVSKDRPQIVSQNSVDQANKLIQDLNASPLLSIEPQSVSKIKTDEHIPNQTQKLIETTEAIRNGLTNEKGCQDQQAPTVHQKYDLVSKNNQDQEQFELEQNLQNCKFQQLNGPEPEDSDMMERMSMRSSQTQNVINNQLINPQSQQAPQNNVRRTNSQENRQRWNAGRILNHLSSQSGFSMSGHHCLSSSQKDQSTLARQYSATASQSQEIGGILKHKSFKGIKLNKIRIIEKTTVYVIGLSPQLADKSIMPKYEFFGQYGQIQKIMIRNKDNSSEQESLLAAPSGNQQLTNQITAQGTSVGAVATAGVCGESTSSSKSQLSYAAHITYSTPEDASLAILALDKFVFDGRKIRASYGRTKFCKYFLQNTVCPDRKNCPYLHKDCKEQDILTPDDMQRKEELFQQCQKLSIQVSKIAEMTESQYRNLLQHKRDLLCHRNNLKHILPKVESIFENKELIKNINLFRKTIQKNKKISHLQVGQAPQTATLPQAQPQKTSVATSGIAAMAKGNSSQQKSQKKGQPSRGVGPAPIKAGPKDQKSMAGLGAADALDLALQTQVSACTTNSAAGTTGELLSAQRNKIVRSGSHRQQNERRDDSKWLCYQPPQPAQNLSTQQGATANQGGTDKKAPDGPNADKSGTCGQLPQRRNSYTRPPNRGHQGESQLIDIQIKDMKTQRDSVRGDGAPPSLAVEVTRVESPKMQDLLQGKSSNQQQQVPQTLPTTTPSMTADSSPKVDELIKDQDKKQQRQGLRNLRQNATESEKKVATNGASEPSLSSASMKYAAGHLPKPQEGLGDANSAIVETTQGGVLKAPERAGRSKGAAATAERQREQVDDPASANVLLQSEGSTLRPKTGSQAQSKETAQPVSQPTVNSKPKNSESAAVDAPGQDEPGSEEGRQIKDQISKKRADRAAKVGASGRRHFDQRDRRKSVSKSIQRGQRQNSMSSHVEYTLKYVLNDDMAICNTNQKYKQEPLIEKTDESEIENQSLINQMIFQNQKLYSLGGKDYYDVKSSYFSNQDSRQGYANAGVRVDDGTVAGTTHNGNHHGYHNTEINLQKINNIYTSPFFLINAQCREKADTKESVQKIWEDFDYLEDTLMNHVNNSNMSDHHLQCTAYQGGFDSQSQQDCVMRPKLMLSSAGGQAPAGGTAQQNIRPAHNMAPVTQSHQHLLPQHQSTLAASPTPAAWTMPNNDFDSLSMNNLFTISSNNQKLLGSGQYAGRGSFQMDNVRMQNMISLYSQSMQQARVQAPPSRKTAGASSVTDSQAKTHMSITAKPFYKNQNDNTVNQSVRPSLQPHAAVSVGQASNARAFMQQPQLVQSNYSMASASAQVKAAAARPSSDADGGGTSTAGATPGKPKQTQNSSKALLKGTGADDLFDKSQHWNQIFLQDNAGKSHKYGRHSFTKAKLPQASSSTQPDVQVGPQMSGTCEGAPRNQPQVGAQLRDQDSNTKLTSNILTSRSVFSFPILDDALLDHEGSNDSLRLRWKRKGRSKAEQVGSGRNSRRRRSHHSSRRELDDYCFEMSHSQTPKAGLQKRKSVCVPRGGKQTSESKEKNRRSDLSADSQSREYDGQCLTQDEQQQILQPNTPMKSRHERQDSTTCSGALNKVSTELPPLRKSNPFSLAQCAKNTGSGGLEAEVDFERRSAGERFRSYQQSSTGCKQKKTATTSAYHEFIKVNDLFSGVLKMRRNSCSKSQSHSRVRDIIPQHQGRLGKANAGKQVMKLLNNVTLRDSRSRSKAKVVEEVDDELSETSRKLVRSYRKDHGGLASQCSLFLMDDEAVVNSHSEQDGRPTTSRRLSTQRRNKSLLDQYLLKYEGQQQDGGGGSENCSAEPTSIFLQASSPDMTLNDETDLPLKKQRSENLLLDHAAKDGAASSDQIDNK